MRRYALCLLLVAAPAPAPAPVTAHAQFRHEPTGFQFSPPEWMYTQGEDLLAPLSRIACWVVLPDAEMPWIRMCVERLDELPKSDETLSFQWKGRTVRGSRIRAREGKEVVMQYSALIPLRLETVRLDVVTPVRNADEAKTVLEMALDSVVDFGLWTVPQERERSAEERSARALGRLAGKLGVGAVIAGVGLWIRQRRARRKEESESGAVAA